MFGVCRRSGRSLEGLGRGPEWKGSGGGSSLSPIEKSQIFVIGHKLFREFQAFPMFLATECFIVCFRVSESPETGPHFSLKAPPSPHSHPSGPKSPLPTPAPLNA